LLKFQLIMYYQNIWESFFMIMILRLLKCKQPTFFAFCTVDLIQDGLEYTKTHQI
jgi:hypothetical protein